MQTIRKEDPLIPRIPRYNEAAERSFHIGQKHKAPWAQVILSLVGILLTAGFIAQPKSLDHDESSFFIWILFSTLCILGATATVLPHHCRHIKSSHKNLDPASFTILKGVRLIHGHHPTCEKFNNHEFKLGEKTFCASCIGLFIGAVSALSIATLNFLYDYSLPALFGYIGLGFVILGLSYLILLKTEIPALRPALNIFLVVGFALVLITVNDVGNIVFDLVVIGLCVQWILTRIQLSRWNHNVICSDCSNKCGGKMAH